MPRWLFSTSHKDIGILRQLKNYWSWNRFIKAFFFIVFLVVLFGILMKLYNHLYGDVFIHGGEGEFTTREDPALAKAVVVSIYHRFLLLVLFAISCLLYARFHYWVDLHKAAVASSVLADQALKDAWLVHIKFGPYVAHFEEAATSAASAAEQAGNDETKALVTFIVGTIGLFLFFGSWFRESHVVEIYQIVLSDGHHLQHPCFNGYLFGLFIILFIFFAVCVFKKNRTSRGKTTAFSPRR